jgi:hypothetical protein
MRIKINTDTLAGLWESAPTWAVVAGCVLVYTMAVGLFARWLVPAKKGSDWQSTRVSLIVFFPVMIAVLTLWTFLWLITSGAVQSPWKTFAGSPPD